MSEKCVITAVIIRSGEQTCAVVRAQVNEPVDEGRLLEKIRAAVDSWAMESDRGRQALEAASYDFNVGDLHHELDPAFGENVEIRYEPEAEHPETLEHHLRRQGIVALSVQCFVSQSERHHWRYDTHLFRVTRPDVDEAADARRRR